jgi:hypothetical protein
MKDMSWNWNRRRGGHHLTAAGADGDIIYEEFFILTAQRYLVRRHKFNSIMGEINDK